MTDPTQFDPLSGGDRLRALENTRSAEHRAGSRDGLDGLREYSTAWLENRSTAYLLQKSWADPISRWFFIAVVTIILIGWAYLFLQ